MLAWLVSRLLGRYMLDLTSSTNTYDILISRHYYMFNVITNSIQQVDCQYHIPIEESVRTRGVVVGLWATKIRPVI